MFGSGFEKIAVSGGYIKKHLGGHFDKVVTPTVSSLKPEMQKRVSEAPHFAKWMTRHHEHSELLRDMENAKIPYAKRHQLGKMMVRDYKEAHRMLDPKRMHGGKPAAKKGFGMGAGLLLGAAAAGTLGAAYLARKRKKKSKGEMLAVPEPEAQVENNYDTAAHLERDPAFQLLMRQG